MISHRIYECDSDALFLRSFRERPEFTALVAKLVTGREIGEAAEIFAQQRHIGSPGSIDLILRFTNGPIILIENKIDAGYSVTREGFGQPHRYQKTVAAYRNQGVEAFSVLLAPDQYLKGSRLANMFDVRISYEYLRKFIGAADRLTIDVAIQQANSPYEPLPNDGAISFFKAMRQLLLKRYPTLVMKSDPNADGIRPTESRTIYFEVSKTLRVHSAVPRPRMSLQCRDSGAPSASVKIMLPGLAKLTERTTFPMSLTDIGGYLRRAGGSLGIVIDTPRLDTQKPFADQADDVVDALEAALRLQYWWNGNDDLLRSWTSMAGGLSGAKTV
ncbi:hypothetical protein [Bradyrhizobium sp. JYMT SZCCT0428]|uniref:hypothetical protein n=1 Tax=Bradyrhizobium sp. JYMT SZCCT0428 TaxID=2807673 RepID=UPI001BA831F7|nr:hypothetical protein [Bradyrhizobium sp. JYMT SZCCT0428]MBR1151206.1 hypothetical protein [Bradyrhizobium sp. JYMT SZCCT0428]